MLSLAKAKTAVPTLIFAVTSLNLLVNVLLHLALENSCPGRLVEAGRLEDVCGIDPVVRAPAHDMFFQVDTKLEFVHGNLVDEQDLLACLRAQHITVNVRGGAGRAGANRQERSGSQAP